MTDDTKHEPHEDGAAPVDGSGSSTDEAGAAAKPDDAPAKPRRAAVVSLLGPATSSEDANESGAEQYDVDSLPRGTQLGRFVLLGRIAETPSGVIYGAYDPEGDRKVSLKLFHPAGTTEAQTHEDQVARVQQAQALAKLDHPCVERIYEAGTYGPWVFLATEFVDGIDLRQWMKVRDEPFPWPEVLRLFREAGRGLSAAHKGGIVHRDFRPSNVLLGKEGRLVVVDFGLAPAVVEEEDDIKLSELRESLPGVTKDEADPLGGRRAGTPAYMAPEQHLTGFADARSDQFSFCVGLYEALYGERPFSGNRPRAIALEVAKHKVRPAPPSSSVPAWLRAVVLRGLHPHPALRYPTMEALLRELARDPAASRRRWVWGAVLAGGLATGGTALAFQLEADRSACGTDGDAQTEAWSADRRDALRDAFEATGRSWATNTWRHTESHLDAWSTEWRGLAERACLSTRVWGDAADVAYQHRMRCLDRELDGFETTLDVLDEIDAATLDQAHALAVDFPSSRYCLDHHTVIAMGLPPQEQREEIDALARELTEIEVRLHLGQTAAVEHTVVEIQPRLQATGDETTIARGQLLLGQMQARTHDEAAEQTLHTAAQTALRAGHSPIAIDAWISRMNLLVAQGRAPEAASLGDYAAATLDNKRFVWLRTGLEIVRGHVERARGRPAEALGHYHAAIEYEDGRGTPTDPLRLVPAWLGLAEIHMARDDVDDAVGPLETALDATRDVLGPQHPAAVVVLERLGRVQRQRGQLADARAFLEQALEIAEQGATLTTVRRSALDGAIGTLAA
ncbi:MAG: serine/threonine-protein kinase, partial [Deltaproteobacteria bacterium]|nr:serine/threonine-protein kinase [Deltaproteobacteria bacterium]